ncbi:hypothetical protein MSG28_013266 [Choristoneura fumiferana]|uniref:Uncharacterized protein n=1 Tax=Choristoneura fumiferana TaxID=7141 RepID=A0ACC0KT82_CHOFU|nr:hypothetical protein MSG28_013266 [Choristoneura fumiferana]
MAVLLLSHGKFPNHIIEMQVEMVDPTPEPPKNSLSNPDNRPVYMSDLKEAVEALEKKLIKSTPGDGTPPNYFKKLSGGTQAPQEYEAAIEAIDNNNPSGIKSIGDVISLVKKGVKVQFDITRPTDRNLDWIQIKVPNA